MDTNSGHNLVGPSKSEAALSMRDVLTLPALADARLVGGASGLARPVTWSHVVDMPDPAPWVPAGYFLLTTGYSWPERERDQIALIEGLCAGGIGGIGLACPKYRDAFSTGERAVADRLGIPLIEIPWDIPFARITQELHRALMAEPYRVIERSEQIHRALMRAASREATLDDLARILYPLIGRSITFENPHGKLLAHCSVEGAADAIRRMTLQNAQAPQSMLHALETTGLDRRIKNSDKPVRVPAMPEIGLTARVACPIRLGSELVGIVWIIEGDEPLSELDHRAAEYAALVAAIHIAHQRELASLESSLGHASVLSLLESDPSRTASAEERVRLLGFDTEKTYRVAIVELPEELPLAREGFLRRDRVARRVREALAQCGVEQLVSVTLDRVPFLLPEGVSAEEVL
ncbi:MAG: PucR family transcriptional regulator ligand-binding domain-containing protein, partial [Candidatus Eremiobacteraeota bacterium]|nr:PucR family transcriptional regulator ligand-binding domain-containing protein [Candidatus Eremiobacteraeota bacterium]